MTPHAQVKVLEGRTVMNKETDEEPYAVVSKFRVRLIISEAAEYHLSRIFLQPRDK